MTQVEEIIQLLERLKGSTEEPIKIERDVGPMLTGNTQANPAVVEKTGLAEIVWFRRLGGSGRVGTIAADRSSLALQLDPTRNHVITILSSGALLSHKEQRVMLLEGDRVWISRGSRACLEPLTNTLRGEIISWADAGEPARSPANVRSVPPRKKESVVHL
jgi:hypothetical protein